MTMPMALNLFDLVSEDHHPTQSHRFRVRPMTKVYSLRDMKREMRGGGSRRLARIPLKLFSEDHQNNRIFWKVEALIQTYSELFS